jgi:hypothetical protein
MTWSPDQMTPVRPRGLSSQRNVLLFTFEVDGWQANRRSLSRKPSEVVCQRLRRAWGGGGAVASRKGRRGDGGQTSKRSRNALTVAGSLARYCGCCFVVVMMAGGLRLWLRLRERASECGVRGICLRTAVQRRTMLRWAVDARLLSLPQNSERMRYEGVLLWHSSRWGACRK